MAYEFTLPMQVASLHPVYHVSILKKFLSDPASILPVEGLVVDENFSYEEVPIEILDRQVKQLRKKDIATLKVLWMNHLVEGST